MKILASVWQYGICIALALLLGPKLATAPMFKELALGDTQLQAASLVEFGSYGIALFLLWVLGDQIAIQIPEDGKKLSFLRRLIPPLTLLIVIIVGHKFLGPFIRQFAGETNRSVGDAIFIVGYIGTVLWLILLGVHNSAMLMQPPESEMSRQAPASFKRRTISLQLADDAKDKTLDEKDKTLPLISPSGNPQKVNRDTTAQNDLPSMRRALGRYAVIKELGRGAMGVVYLGKDPTIQRFVALKTVPFNAVDEPGQLPEIKRRFFSEAETIGRLSHPNIVTIYDAGEEGELGYIAMEVLEGITLKDWCCKDNLQPVKRVLGLVAKVAEALDHAHSQGVVHRDIKPANIMTTKSGIVKLTDFGIARITTSTKTSTNVILGTPSYMSPEQIAGGKVDGRSDLFSLGVVLYELLTGERPFQGESVAPVLFQIVNTPHRSPVQIRADLPPCCAAIIDRALHKDVGQRYQSGHELALDLGACLQTLPD